MKRALKLLLAAAALSAAAFANGAPHPYCSVTTQEVDAVKSEITWWYDVTTYETQRGIVTGLKLAEIEGVLIESSPKLPTVSQVGSQVMSVVEYGDDVFAGQTLIKDIAIPDTIKKIGDRAFEGCLSLDSVSFGKAVTEVGDEVFYDCDSLSSVTFNEGLRHIGKRPFVNTAITEIALPDTLLDMDGNIAAGTLYGAAISISDSSHFSYSDDGYCLYNKDKTRLYCCQPRAEGLVALDDSLLEIMPDSFFGCFRLTNIVVGASVTNIGSKAFNVKGIWPGLAAPESVAKLASVTYKGAPPACAANDIYDGAPDALVNYVPEKHLAEWGDTWRGRKVLKVPTIGQGASGSEALTDGTWYYRVVNGFAELWRTNSAGEYVCALVDQQTVGNITLPEKIGGFVVKSIAPCALANLRGITSVTISSTYETIGDYAFTNCTALASVAIPSGVRSLGKAPFAGTAITALALPNTVTALDGNPLAGCAFLTSVSVDAGSAAFAAEDGMLFDAAETTLLAYVPSAASVVLPKTLEAIAPDAFAGCSRLLAVGALCEVPDADDAIFTDTPAKLVVSADAWALKSWQSFIGKEWKSRTFENAGIPDSDNPQTYTDGQGNSWDFTTANGTASIVSISSVPSGEISIPATVTVSGSDDPIAVTSVSQNLLANCTAITKVTVPASVTNLTGAAFVGCTALESFAVEAGSAHFTTCNGVLYSRDGKTLVKVPAGFRFAATMTADTTTVTQSVIEVINGFDDNLNPVPNTVIVTDESGTVKSKTVYAFTPAVSVADLMSGVTFVADYAFADCGYLPAGTVADGTLVTTKDGKVVSTEKGLVEIPVGTDATNETAQTSAVAKSGFYNKQIAVWKTVQATETTNVHNVPKPNVGSAVCAAKAWVGSIWAAETGKPSGDGDDDSGDTGNDDDDAPVPLTNGATVSVSGGVSQTIQTGVDSTTAKSVTASGLPTGLKLVKTTDKTTGVTTWSIQGTATKTSTKTATLTVTNKDKSKTKITFVIAARAVPAWATGAFNGVVYDAEANAVGAATAQFSSLGKLSGKLQMPSANGTKAMSYSFTMKNFFSYDEEAACYRGTATVKFGSKKRDVAVTCMETADGTGALMLDLGEDGAVDLVQNVWKRKDLTPPSYKKNATVTIDGFTFKFLSAGKVKWSGTLRGDNGANLKVSGSSQLLNDASTILLYVPPRRNLVGGLAAIVDLNGAD